VPVNDLLGNRKISVPHRQRESVEYASECKKGDPEAAFS